VNDDLHLGRSAFSLRLRIVATGRLAIQLATLTSKLAVTASSALTARNLRSLGTLGPQGPFDLHQRTLNLPIG